MTPKTKPAGEKTYYVADIAEMLNLSRRTVRYYVKQGWLTPVQYNGLRLQFNEKSIKDFHKVMEERMEKERMRRSIAMKKMRKEQMAEA